MKQCLTDRVLQEVRASRATPAVLAEAVEAVAEPDLDASAGGEVELVRAAAHIASLHVLAFQSARLHIRCKLQVLYCQTSE